MIFCVKSAMPLESDVGLMFLTVHLSYHCCGIFLHRNGCVRLKIIRLIFISPSGFLCNKELVSESCVDAHLV